ncbi:hypothetical protein EV643_119143 [Kribbella sp. VKM Ac-2527]|uniref:DUF5667 domain-containing protein n=1 Tax=Kribbella caucasensis TaxID=2512215 RepID=A0A4R6K1W5_9ACTN|nr:hypothetical protein EV643_119143 [Kribbella sp. VKM Ac-2527]
MSDLTRARARAESFAHAVDHGPRHSSRLSDDPELLEAVELVGRLRTAGAVAPRPEFSAELRHRLLEQAAARAATTPTVVRSTPSSEEESPPREDDASVTQIRPRHGRRIRLVASTAALVLLGGGIGSAAAAQQAMPGDTLYGMKRSIENVSTNVSVGDDSRGRRDLEHAMNRLSEVRALVGNGGDVATIDSTLDDFSVQARKGVSRLVASYQQDGDTTSITAITEFITSARQAIGELAPQLPPESLKSAVEALATIEQLAQHTSVACPKCDQPKPAKNSGQPSVDRPGTQVTEPKDPSNPVPSADPTTGGGPTVIPSQAPNTTAVEEKNTAKPTTPLATPPGTKPSSTPTSTPSGPLPTLPTAGTPSWPWPFPTTPIISLPTLNIPGVLETLLPPWK